MAYTPKYSGNIKYPLNSFATPLAEISPDDSLRIQWDKAESNRSKETLVGKKIRIMTEPSLQDIPSLILGNAPHSISLPEQILFEYSTKAFECFKNVWEFSNFWKRANTCDATLCFIAAFCKRWPKDPQALKFQQTAKEMLVSNLTYFKSFDLSSIWADDLGWWGLMGLNAYKLLKRMGDNALAKEYLKVSTHFCWENLLNFAYDHSEEAKPIPHGFHNGDAKGEHKGVKNTVVNALTILLSTRLYRLLSSENCPDKDQYLEMAYRQWVWFTSWFQLQEYEYLKHIDDSAALVQERPTAFYEGSNYQDPSHPSWSAGWVWSGDQGLLIGALVDLLLIKNDLKLYLDRTQPGLRFDETLFESTVQLLLQKVALGVQKALVGNNDGIMREAPFAASFGALFGSDYLAGRGILIRYLGAAETQAALRDVDLRSTINATVNGLWSTRAVDTNQFKPEFTTAENDLDYIKQFQSLWGTSDQTTLWQIDSDDPLLEDGVCQAIGLDFLGAAICCKPS